MRLRTPTLVQVLAMGLVLSLLGQLVQFSMLSSDLGQLKAEAEQALNRPSTMEREGFRAELSDLRSRLAKTNRRVESMSLDALGPTIELGSLESRIGKMEDYLSSVSFAGGTSSDTSRLEVRVAALEGCLDRLIFSLTQGTTFVGC